MAGFHLLPVTHENYKTDERLEYDNVIPVPKVFVEHWNDTRPYQIWYGARFTGKSYQKAQQLLLKAINQDYFRCVFARRTQKAARESQFQLFQDVLKMYPAGS